MLVIRQKLPKQSKTIARAVVKLAVRNEIFCPFAQLRIPATYFTLKQLIKGSRPFGLLISQRGEREIERGGLCSLQSWQALPQCWSLNNDIKYKYSFIYGYKYRYNNIFKYKPLFSLNTDTNMEQREYRHKYRYMIT